jgi:hypothetical protein
MFSNFWSKRLTKKNRFEIRQTVFLFSSEKWLEKIEKNQRDSTAKA